MSASKDDDDYWYGSDKLAFSFDNNEVIIFLFILEKVKQLL